MSFKGRWGPIIAIMVLVGVSIWMLLGDDVFTRASNTPPSTSKNAASEAPPSQKNRVQARISTAQSVQRTLKLSGETRAKTELNLLNQFAGTVEKVLVKQGQHVAQGSAILQLDTRRLRAQLNEADALVQQRRLELQGIQRLQTQNLTSQVKVATAKSALASAQASQTALKIELEDATIHAPFAGVINDFTIEPGQWLGASENVATLIDITPLTIRLNVPQQDLQGIALGTPGHVHIMKTVFDSQITYISAKADIATRSVPIELTIENHTPAFAAGLTATVVLTLPSVNAHAISPALLQINDNGALSLKTLNEQSQVQSKVVTIVKEERDHVWVTGLADKETIITVGQGFVDDGESVSADFDS